MVSFVLMFFFVSKITPEKFWSLLFLVKKKDGGLLFCVLRVCAL